MNLDLRPLLRPEARLIITPQLQLAIKILQISGIDLQKLVDAERRENPTLELDDVPGPEPETTEPGQCEPKADNPEPAIDPIMNVVDKMLSPDWQPYLDDHFNDRHDTLAFDPPSNDDVMYSSENRLTKKITLADHLTGQLRLSGLTERDELIGSYIIGNLDDNGYLAVTLEDICTATKSTIHAVEAVLKRIRFFDPVGVAARDLRECLLTQLESLELTESLAARIVSDCLGLLESKRYERIARELGVTVDEIAEAAHVITSLEPRPSRSYEQDEVQFVVPDVRVERNGDNYVFYLNDEDMPQLRVSAFCQRLAGRESEAENETRRYVKDRIRAAKWLIDAIKQRQSTLLRVTQAIFKFQREFLDHGVRHLRPMMLRDVAEDIKVHESTVCRASANKWVDTPHGIFELKWFFQSSITTADGDLGSESVKAKIRDVISEEDPRRPHSDQHIAAVLSRDSIEIARRTVAKYREAMGILPSSKRSRPYLRK